MIIRRVSGWSAFLSFSLFPFLFPFFSFLLPFPFLFPFSFFFSGKNLRDPGSNQGPPDLQSGALPTELSRKNRPRPVIGEKLSWMSTYLLN